MRITDAIWEKRNLGVSCAEILLETGDERDCFEKLKEIKSDYQVLKLPAQQQFPISLLQECGFVYAEDLIEVEHDLHVPARSRLHQRLYDAMDYHMMDETDYQTLLGEVKDGMFSTDRIALDPAFGPEASARRYMGWLSDLKEAGALFYGISYKGEVAGFIVLQTKDGGKSYTSVLGGGYKKYRSSGLGIVQKEYEIVKRLGGKRVYTRVSSNNPGQLKALVLNGWLPVGIEHVFVKHKERSEKDG